MTRLWRWAAVLAAGALASATTGCATHAAPQRDSVVPTIDLSGSRAEADVAYSPQPERSFIWVGANQADQFSDRQLERLAEHYDIVVLAKFHARYDIAAHHEAARRLVSLRPDVRVFPYFSMRYWFDKNRWGETILPEWLLRDAEGDLVERDDDEDREGGGAATFVDLANPDYRAWALDVLASWLLEAPYAGVAFDAVAPLGEGDAESVAAWEERLGRERVAAYDRGLRELLAAAKDLVGPTRTIIYNGIAPNLAVRGEDRNLGLLELADAALDERFCLDVDGSPHVLDEDLDLLAGGPEGELLMRTALPRSFSPGQAADLEAFCVGAFLVGWEPGRSYFQAGRDYTAAQLDRAAPDLDVNLGLPLGPPVREGEVVYRQFERGLVVVNLGPDPAPVSVSEPVTQVRGGRVVGRHEPGSPIVVGVTDALYLLRGRVA